MEYPCKCNFRWKWILLLFAYFVFLFLVGNKFSAIFLGGICFLFTSGYLRYYFLNVTRKYKKRRKYYLYIIVVILFLSYSVYSQVDIYYGPASLIE